MAGEYHFIVNPSAGRGKVSAVLRQVLDGLERAGHTTVVHVTSGPGDAAAIAAQLNPRAAAVVAVGGDGTVREVSEGLVGRGPALAILPSGTENLVAKQTAYRAHPDHLLNALEHGSVRRIDLGRVGGRTFLVVAGIGFDAEVVRRLARRRRGHITHLDYLNPAWRAFWEHDFPELCVSADGERVFEGAGLVFVGNMPRYGLGLRILRRATPDDGKLDLCIYPCRGRLKLLGHALRTACRLHLSLGDALYLQARTVEVSSPWAVPVELDGDECGSLPVRIETLPLALPVLVPPNASF